VLCVSLTNADTVIILGAARSGPKARLAAAIVKSRMCARTICMCYMWLPLLTSV